MPSRHRPKTVYGRWGYPRWRKPSPSASRYTRFGRRPPLPPAHRNARPPTGHRKWPTAAVVSRPCVSTATSTPRSTSKQGLSLVESWDASDDPAVCAGTPVASRWAARAVTAARSLLCVRFPTRPSSEGRGDARDDSAHASRSVAARSSHVRGTVHGGRNPVARRRGRWHRCAALRGYEPRSALSHRPAPAGAAPAPRLGGTPQLSRNTDPDLATRPAYASRCAAEPPHRLARGSSRTRLGAALRRQQSRLARPHQRPPGQPRATISRGRRARGTGRRSDRLPRSRPRHMARPPAARQAPHLPENRQRSRNGVYAHSYLPRRRVVACNCRLGGDRNHAPRPATRPSKTDVWPRQV